MSTPHPAKEHHGDRTADRRAGRIALATVGTALLATTLAACGGSAEPNASPSLVPGASSGGKLTIGIPTDEPGLGMKDGDTYAGFDVETATYVAKALGVPAENITFVEAEGDTRQQLLTSGGADLIVSTFSITDERKQVVDFAGPYFDAEQDLLVRRNEEDITGPGDAQRADPVHGGRHDLGRQHPQGLPGQGHAAGEAALLRVRGRPGRERGGRRHHRRRDPRGLRGRAAVQGQAAPGRAGASRRRRYGIGVKKGDTEMVTKVNAALKEYVADGSWKAALKKTVGPSGYDLPSPPEDRLIRVDPTPRTSAGSSTPVVAGTRGLVVGPETSLSSTRAMLRRPLVVMSTLALVGGSRCSVPHPRRPRPSSQPVSRW